jgi:putative ABC transport system permease protein
MINAILRFAAIFIVTIKRIFAQRGLALATSLGIIAAVALAMSIPIYSDAVYQNILENEVYTGSATEGAQSTRPPFAFMYRYVGAWSGAIPLDQLHAEDVYLSGPVATDLGLTPKVFVRYLKTDTLKLFSATQGSYTSTAEPLAYVYFSAIGDLEKHINLIEGAMPAPASTTPDSVIDVLMSEERATQLGLHPGELYNVFISVKNDQTTTVVNYPIRVAGIWVPKDPGEPYWFYNASEFNESLLVPEATLTDRVIPYMKNEIYLAVWYWVMDGSKVQSADVPTLLGRIAGTRQKATNLLQKIRLDVSPEEVLQRYQTSAQSLTIFLYAFSIPLLLMILTFIGLVVDMAVGQRRNEIAVLRSRGSTAVQVMGMAALESMLLGAIGLVVGTPSAQGLAQVFGKAKSFLDFSASTSLHAQITVSAIRFGLVTAAVALLAQVVPTWTASQHTIITYKQDRARQTRAPWWQRAWLDVLLFIPAAYGTYMLQKGPGAAAGSNLPGAATALSNDPFQNPLLLLVPALGIFALTLLLLRLLPYLMRIVAWVASHTGSVGILLASRYLSRTSSGYSAPLILLVMTLSLSTFTATLAQTLDRHMNDQTFYKVGADVSVAELGEQQGGNSSFGPSATQGGQDTSGDTAATDTTATERWYFLPVSEHLKVPGVKAAARVMRTQLRLVSGSGAPTATFIGVDRIDFAQVAFWRRDFAPTSLGALMNDLGYTTEGVVVSRDLLGSKNIRLGDTIRVSTFQLGETREFDLKVIGIFDYFPTWYPEEGPLIVGNLDYFFESVGGEFPYDVWMKVDPKADPKALIKGVDDLYHRVLNPQISSAILTAEQLRPERQGFFGLLSVGFAALAFLTVLGFLLYALFSFRRRFIELGMLRAIGLSTGQMLEFLASELAFLFLSGLGAGTALGVTVSNLFIPHLQVGNDMAARIPPFLVRIDWSSVFQVYILFGVLFVVALVVLGVLLVRMKIFQAVKLGEAV